MKRTNSAKWIETRSRWQINVQKDGIRRTFTSTKQGKEGQLEANAKADLWLDEGITDTKKTVLQASKDYLNDLQITVSYSFWRQYEYYFRVYIVPQIGTVRVENLSEQYLQGVINAAYKNGLSKKTLQSLRGCLVAFVKYCRKSKLTTLFPEDLTIPRNAPTTEKKILQPDALKLLFSDDTVLYKGKIEKDGYINAYRFQVLTGLRPGELVGLKWSDIQDGTVNIRRAINIHNETTTGKNANARRNFNLNIFTNAVLENQKEYLKENYIISDYVFPQTNGKPITQNTYNQRWGKYQAFHKMDYITPYELRHSFVSIVKDMPEGYLKTLVGHSKSMDTYGVYSHEMQNDKQAAAQMIQEIFKNILTG